MSLTNVKHTYTDTEQWNTYIHDKFCEEVNKNAELKELRDFVEQNAFGFGERSFYWMWKLIVDEMPKEFTFLEIGVFRGQTTTLIQLLAKQAGKNVKVYGVTPQDATDGHWDSDYPMDLFTLEKKFNVPHLNIFRGLSTDPKIIQEVSQLKFDIVYIDGGHTYEVIKSDLEVYPKLTKDFLVVDDCANRFKIPFGMFAGIESVSNAVDEVLPPFGNKLNFDYLFNVVHNRIWRINNGKT